MVKKGFIYSINEKSNEPYSIRRDITAPVANFYDIPAVAYNKGDGWSIWSKHITHECPHCHKKLEYCFSIAFKGMLAAPNLELLFNYSTPWVEGGKTTKDKKKKGGVI